MKVDGVQFPVSDGSVEVHPAGKIGRFFVDPQEASAGWTWVKNVLGSDTVDYSIAPAMITLISHSTHDNLQDNSKQTVKKSDHEFDQLQAFYYELRALALSNSTR